MPIIKVPATGGVVSDGMGEELDLGQWSTSLNMRFRNGYAEKCRGFTQVYTTPSVTPYWLQPYSTATTRFMVHAGLAAAYVDDGSTRTDITGTAPTGAVDDRWTGGVLNGVLIMNNGKDLPMFWAGNTANNLATLTNWDSNEICYAMRPWKNYLFALRVKKTSTWYPYMVKWSAAADPGAVPASWDEGDAANDAGEIDLAETPDLLIDAIPFGDALIIFKERSAYAARYVGGQFIFQFQRIPGDVGMLARGCGTVTPRGLVVLTSGDVVLFDGGQFRSICEGTVRREIWNSIDSTNAQRSFVVANPTKNEVWICYPEADQSTCTKAAVWNWNDETWTFRSLPNVTYGTYGQVAGASSTAWSGSSDTWATQPDQWNTNEYSTNETRLVMCHSTPYISLADTSGSDFGSTISTTLERVGVSLGDTQGRKLIRGVWPRIDAAPGTQISIQVGATDTPDGTPSYATAKTFTVGTDAKIDTFASGRYLTLKLTSATPQSWRLRGFDVDAVQAGRY